MAAALLSAMLVLGTFLPKGMPEAPPPKTARTIPDTVLYRHISSRVAQGESYYSAAADEQRRHDLPLRPFVTVRLPTMGWMNALVDPQLVLHLLLAITVAAWMALPGLRIWERVALAVAIAAGSWQAFADYSAWVHEYWCGLLLALSVAVHPRNVTLSIVIALAAALIRELALPFLLLGCAFALIARSWREALEWTAAIGVFALALGLHAWEVSAVALAGDKASPGWFGLLGYPAAIDRIAQQSPLGIAPGALAAAIAALGPAGWLGLRNRTGFFMCAYMLGMLAFLAIFPRDNNLFWSVLVAPLWLAGLVFLPRLARWLAGRAGPREPEAAAG
ncbi:MAG: hypothetical protein J7496_05875 [Novosphingobium sp.]|nr:hypothetical protein [Novosphingobium sp.]